MNENNKKKDDKHIQNEPLQNPKPDGSASQQPHRASGQIKKKRKKKRRRLSRAAKLLMAGLCALVLGVAFYFYWEHETGRNVTLTYLDSISLGQLEQVPQASFDESIQVDDLTIYGNSLVFYDQEFSPLETDTFFGRNVTLRNIKDGSTITTAFTGGADAGIDLDQLPQGVYEVYLSDGYTPKRAYMAETTLPAQFVTTRNNGMVKKINIVASPNYLAKFNLQSDKPYLYISVTDSEPVETVADVVIDPMGYGMAGLDEEGQDDRLADGFSEYEQSWNLASKIRQRLEAAGLKVIFSQTSNDNLSYQGDPSRIADGYRTQAKVYLSLGMVNEDYAYPFIVSSPFTNGKLGNMIVQELNAYGVGLETISTLTQLNAGNGFDQLGYDQELRSSPYSVTAPIRESGGKVTSAGKEEGWQGNAQYSQSYGMNGVFFAYASTSNAASRTYYLEHVDAIADGIAQGILDYGHISGGWNLDEQASSQSVQSQEGSSSGSALAPEASPSEPSVSAPAPAGQHEIPAEPEAGEPQEQPAQ